MYPPGHPLYRRARVDIQVTPLPHPVPTGLVSSLPRTNRTRLVRSPVPTGRVSSLSRTNRTRGRPGPAAGAGAGPRGRASRGARAAGCALPGILCGGRGGGRGARGRARARRRHLLPCVLVPLHRDARHLLLARLPLLWPRGLSNGTPSRSATVTLASRTGPRATRRCRGLARPKYFGLADWPRRVPRQLAPPGARAPRYAALLR